MKQKLWDLKEQNSAYYDTKISTCDLCGKKAEYLLVAKSVTYPLLGVMKTRLLCKDHHKMWHHKKLVI